MTPAFLQSWSARSRCNSANHTHTGHAIVPVDVENRRSAMNKFTTSTAIPTRTLKLEALSSISSSFELFCLASGMEALGEMMDHDAQTICGPRHHALMSGRRTAGGQRGARSASTAVRSKSSGPAFAALTGRNGLCRAGRRRLRGIGSANGP